MDNITLSPEQRSQFEKARVLFEKAQACAEKRNFLGAIACYDKVLKMNGSLSIAWGCKGDLLFHLQRHKEAAECYQKALTIAPDGYDVWCDLGFALFHSGQCYEAIKAFDVAIAHDVELADSWHGRGGALHSLGQFAEALDCYKKSMNVDPTNYQLLSDIGRVLVGLNRPKEAVAFQLQAVKINQEYFPAWFQLGCVFGELEQFADAIFSLERALKLRPGDIASEMLKRVALVKFMEKKN
jgi:tetratricopeptide (TPR) repeat protein